jgi:hypothetical protein
MDDNELPRYPVRSEPAHPVRSPKTGTVDRSPGYMGRTFRGVDAQLPKHRHEVKIQALAIIGGLVIVVLALTVGTAVLTWSQTRNAGLTGGVVIATLVFVLVIGWIGALYVEQRRARRS